MHKITKGLKKKKKGKKSKHKDEDLFKPEELEAYRREHQAQPSVASVVHDASSAQTEAAAGENEEWKKFLALTSGVDDILKKTQGDLDRIKSTSFFKRIPPPSEVKKQEDELRKIEEKEKEEEKQLQEEVAAVQAAIVEVSESESEDEEDDIFDTDYIDAIATGEVKLAYIPESPTEQLDDDPFDTSIADKAILGSQSERKGTKLLPLGSAVEILTGRVEATSCIALKRPNKRQLLQRNFLGSFDESSRIDNQPIATEVKREINVLTLLDDDAPADIASEPIDLSKSLVIPAKSVEESTQPEPEVDANKLAQEFEEDDDDLEFGQLATESLNKQVPSIPDTVEIPQSSVILDGDWNAQFEAPAVNDDVADEVDIDPFDTTFADNILPGQAELKVIEREILNNGNDYALPEIKLPNILTNLTNAVNNTQPDIPVADCENLLSTVVQETKHDWLAGSCTDLTQLADEPLKPADLKVEEPTTYEDPFDTSNLEKVGLPGQTELKFLERELLSDITVKSPIHVVQTLEDDDDFDPRREDDVPKILNSIESRKVSFDLPLQRSELLSLQRKEGQLQTPYYSREDSIPETDGAEFEPNFDEIASKVDFLSVTDAIDTKVLTPQDISQQSEFDDTDPFDTSIASNLVPGQVELKLLESDLLHDHTVQPTKPGSVEDYLEIATDHVFAKTLTPIVDNSICDFDNDEDIDPFDTSIANNIAPGPSELKIIESELI